MIRSVIAVLIPLALVTCLFPALAFGAQLNSEANAVDVPSAYWSRQGAIVQMGSKAKPMDLHFENDAFWTNGKGSAYEIYTDPSRGYYSEAVVYRARIKGSKLYLSGAYRNRDGNVAKIHRVNKKAFKLTKRTRYYRHAGNNNFYIKWNKAKTRRYLKSKSSSLGGDICFTVKSGRVTALSVQ